MRISFSFFFFRPSASSGGLPSLARVKLGQHPTLWNASRAYYWPYAEDFVPSDGPPPSRFQSSALPSARMNYIRQLALGPLYTEKHLVCTLGWHFRSVSSSLPPMISDSSSSSPPTSIRSLMGKRSDIRKCLAHFFDTDVANILLGSIQKTKEMMLYRGGLAESPRLVDSPGAFPSYSNAKEDHMTSETSTVTRTKRRNETTRANHTCSSSSSLRTIRTFLHAPLSFSSFPASLSSPPSSPLEQGRMLSRRHACARGPITATVLMEVELAPSADITPMRALAYGKVLQHYFYGASCFSDPFLPSRLGEAKNNESDGMNEVKDWIPKDSLAVRSNEGKEEDGSAENFEGTDADNEAEAERCATAARHLREVFGVRYCEVPEMLDSSDYAFQDFWMKSS